MKSNGKRLGFMGDFTLANPRDGLGLGTEFLPLPWSSNHSVLPSNWAPKFFTSLGDCFQPNRNSPKLALFKFFPFPFLAYPWPNTHTPRGTKSLLVSWLVILHPLGHSINFSTEILSSLFFFPSLGHSQENGSPNFSTPSWFLA